MGNFLLKSRGISPKLCCFLLMSGIAPVSSKVWAGTLKTFSKGRGAWRGDLPFENAKWAAISAVICSERLAAIGLRVARQRLSGMSHKSLLFGSRVVVRRRSCHASEILATMLGRYGIAGRGVSSRFQGLKLFRNAKAYRVFLACFSTSVMGKSNASRAGNRIHDACYNSSA